MGQDPTIGREVTQCWWIKFIHIKNCVEPMRKRSRLLCTRQVMFESSCYRYIVFVSHIKSLKKILWSISRSAINFGFMPSPETLHYWKYIFWDDVCLSGCFSVKQVKCVNQFIRESEISFNRAYFHLILLPLLLVPRRFCGLWDIWRLKGSGLESGS